MEVKVTNEYLGTVWVFASETLEGAIPWWLASRDRGVNRPNRYPTEYDSAVVNIGFGLPGMWRVSFVYIQGGAAVVVDSVVLRPRWAVDSLSLFINPRFLDSYNVGFIVVIKRYSSEAILYYSILVNYY